MAGQKTPASHQRKPQEVGFFLLPGFAMMGFSAALEPLRVANRLSGRRLYNWSLLSEDGAEVMASNGILISPGFSISQHEINFDLIIICAGIISTGPVKSPRLLNWVRRLASRGCVIGAISNGAEVLANAGLLNGVRCTIHWENDESFRENHPDAILTGGIFEMDRNRLTSAGGTASLDMMLNWISRTNDDYLAPAIAEQFIHDHLRSAEEFQPGVEIRLVRRRSPKLARAVELILMNTENPLSPGEIARQAGLSRRQLERLFAKYRQKTLHKYYLEARLKKARFLVFHTCTSLLQVSIATGFSSQSHFSRCYKRLFDTTPSQDRRSGEG